MTRPKPHLSKVATGDMPEDIFQMHQRSVELRDEATFYEVMANNPDLLRWYINGFYGEVFGSGRVPVPALEVLRLRLSVQHGCRFCNQGNRVSALEAGLKKQEIDAIFSGEYSVLRRELQPVAALSDELRLTNLGGALSSSLHAQLAAHYSPAQILELGLIGGILTGVAKFLFAFDLVEREESCPFPHPQKDSV